MIAEAPGTFNGFDLLQSSPSAATLFSPMRLSVVLGTLNRLPSLKRGVESIFAQTRTAVRIYVTDAGSTDGTIEWLRGAASDRLVPVFVGRKLGQAKAYNDVFATVDTPYVVWLSDDNEIVNRGLDVAVRILDREPGIGMVGLKVKDRTGPFQAAAYVGGISSVGILNVNQGVLHTDLLKRLGGFSEEFADYGIDPDLTAKVLFSGHSIVYTRKVAIHHYRGWSVDPSCEAYRKMADKQARYLKLYYERYFTAVGRAPRAARARKLLWKKSIGLLRRVILGRLFRSSPSPGPASNGIPAPAFRDLDLFFLNTRDIRNVMNARFVSPLDPLITAGRPYHLVQSCPPDQRPRDLRVEPLRAS